MKKPLDILLQSRITRLIPMVLLLIATPESDVFGQWQGTTIRTKEVTKLVSRMVIENGAIYTKTSKGTYKSTAGGAVTTAHSQEDEWNGILHGWNAYGVFGHLDNILGLGGDFTVLPIVPEVRSHSINWLDTPLQNGAGLQYSSRQVTNSYTWSYSWGEDWYFIAGTVDENESSSAGFELLVGNDSDNGGSEQFVIVDASGTMAVDFPIYTGIYNGSGFKLEVLTPIPNDELTINDVAADGNGTVVLERQKGATESIVVAAANNANKIVSLVGSSPRRVRLTYACHPTFAQNGAQVAMFGRLKSNLHRAAKDIFMKDSDNLYAETDGRIQRNTNVSEWGERNTLYRKDDVPVYIEFNVILSGETPDSWQGQLPDDYDSSSYYDVTTLDDAVHVLSWRTAHIKEVNSIGWQDEQGVFQTKRGMVIGLGIGSILTTPGQDAGGIAHEFGHACGLNHRGMQQVTRHNPYGWQPLFVKELHEESLEDNPLWFYSSPNSGYDLKALMRPGASVQLRLHINRYERDVIFSAIDYGIFQ